MIRKQPCARANMASTDLLSPTCSILIIFSYSERRKQNVEETEARIKAREKKKMQERRCITAITNIFVRQRKTLDLRKATVFHKFTILDESFMLIRPNRKDFKSFVLSLKRLNTTWSVGRIVNCIQNTNHFTTACLEYQKQ